MLNALLYGAIIYLISLAVSKFLQPICKHLLGKIPDRWAMLLGLVSGAMIFFALLLGQEGVIMYDSIAFRVTYLAGCVGFAVLNSKSLSVMALQNAFVLLLGWELISTLP